MKRLVKEIYQNEHKIRRHNVAIEMHQISYICEGNEIKDTFHFGVS